MRSAFEILGVAKDASDDEIHAAYRRLALAAHPDRAGDSPEAHERFLQIRAAYELLRDPARRVLHEADPTGALGEQILLERMRAHTRRRRRRLMRLYHL